MSSKHVSIEVRDNIAVLRLQRPPVNAVNYELFVDFAEALGEIEAMTDVRALVVTGNEKCFCAGLDLKEVVGYDAARLKKLITLLNRTVASLYGFAIPVVGAIGGHAIGGGLILAAACDYRVAADNKGKFGLTEARAGIPFPVVPTIIMNHEFSASAVRVLCLRCEVVDVHEALAMGLVDELQPEGDVLSRALEIARTMAEIPPGAYRTVKFQVRGEAIEKAKRAVADGSDPLVDNWLDPDAQTAAAKVLAQAQGN